ncbi:universal stress protein [Halorussus halophilus]|uniref:universal stress protein n=1 Tax=Halorussus halophilus TaxID=2650975 RepID=UPI001300F17F|nr:universal stress protein [Halorussus halophilus]
MTLVVPFDGSELAQAALVRAAEFGRAFDEDVLAVSVIPKGNAEYAQARGWLGPDEAFEMEAVVSALHERVTDLSPSSDFRHKVVDRYAPSGAISNHLRSVARDEDASMVFIGSENSGHMVTSLSSVGSGIAADDAYDVVIVRNRSPTKITELKRNSPHRNSKSDFYLTE